MMSVVMEALMSGKIASINNVDFNPELLPRPAYLTSTYTPMHSARPFLSCDQGLMFLRVATDDLCKVNDTDFAILLLSFRAFSYVVLS